MWVCQQIGITPCVYLSKLNNLADFCVQVLIVPRVLYHQEEEMYRFLEETILLHKREVITVNESRADLQEKHSLVPMWRSTTRSSLHLQAMLMVKGCSTVLAASTTCTPEESGFGVAKMIALPTARYCVLWDSLARKILSRTRVYYNAIENIAAICNAPGTEKMKPIVQRRQSTSCAITKALDNGLPSGVFSSPGSTFILDERVQLTVGLQTQERHLILFSDMLVISKSKSSSSLKLKKQVHLSEVWTGTCLSKVTEKKMSPENLFVIGWPITNYVVTFSSADVKERWLSALLWHTNEVKQNDYLKNLTLQIIVLDDDNCSSTTVGEDEARKPYKYDCLDSENVKSVSEIELKALPRAAAWQLRARPHIPYNKPHLLKPNFRDLSSTFIHTVLESTAEKLFLQTTAVNVSSVETAESVMKKTLLQLGLPQGRTSEHHLCVVSGKDEPAYPLIELLQKHTKRKKSLIDWALHRSSSTPTGSPSSQSPTTPRKLFGLSLSSVCPDGILPKPIMDMLLLLYHEGPSTRGIFRHSANAKTCKELKEKLNSGDDVQVDGESVFVAAAVITRYLPDTVTLVFTCRHVQPLKTELPLAPPCTKPPPAGNTVMSTCKAAMMYTAK
ncbi:hypothetical protein DUI87_01187 [Hirundo rustica rustica]|uniref:Rho-GAP domain-containing protein n=1 Tax=Hirundo rustica rustica TaxID=333673 RepID=A0A3M0L4M0_HIRRU|nr:hypothetical protein DUI87_01187 [Hirundo rustica rustica]